ncbi:MAG: TolC family protein [Verrucomicrobiota bacterium]
MRFTSVLLGCIVLCLLAGCSTSHYRAAADREVANIIAAKGRAVPNMEPHFTIEQTNQVVLDGYPLLTNLTEFLGTTAETERNAKVISLAQALDLAVAHSRIYQNNKESVYLQALSLTLARHQFEPIFFGRSRADYQTITEEVRIGVDALTGEPKVLSGDAALVEEHRLTGSGSTGVDWLLKTGARLSVAFTTDFLRYITGDPRAFSSSQVAATLVQPLWRGAGYKVAMENLTQAERDLLYALREFTRFQKDFSVQIATSYYRVLQTRDSAANSWRGLQNFRKNVERERACPAERRRTQASLGLIQQSELTTEAGWINAIRAYKQSLDNFKIQLGLSTDANIVLDPADLERLQIAHPDLSAEEAVKVALATRLDLENARDEYEDATRKIAIAVNRLRPQVDLVASAGLGSEGNTRGGFAIPDIDRYHWSAGLNLDLPFERTAERNAYRAAFITQARAARGLEQTEDQIKLQVRDDWRNLDQAKRSYEIAEMGVALSQRRLEEEELRAQVGRGTARDLVDAQNDLIRSKNDRTQALVGHTVARLQFWSDMGVLVIKEHGQWEEINHAK